MKPSPATQAFCLSVLVLADLKDAVAAQSLFDPKPENIVQGWSFEFQSGAAAWHGGYGLAAGYDGAANGRNFANLTGTNWFAAQLLNTVPGQAYQVTFAVSGNSSFAGLSIVRLVWDGAVVGDAVWNSLFTTGYGLNFNWAQGVFDVVAVSPTTEIRLQRNPASTSAGTWLDAVQVVPIPEPSAAALRAFGLVTGFGAKKIRRADAARKIL